MAANVKYRLLLPATPSKECRQEPVLANERVPRVSLFGSLTLRRQVLTDEEGLVQSALLLTQKGWMRLQPSVQDVRQPIRYYPRPTKNGAPAKCWYDADVTVKVR